MDREEASSTNPLDTEHLDQAAISPRRDDDQLAVEVVFNGKSMHRRKSSMVSSDVSRPAPRRSACQSYYLVHHFLENEQGMQGVKQTYGPHSLKGATGTTTSTGPSAAPKGPSSLMADDDKTSRCLTGQQLSDMVWGVRELSRRLSCIKLKCKMRTIFLLASIHNPELIAIARELTRWLLDPKRGSMYTVYVEQTLRDHKAFDLAGLVDEMQKANSAALKGKTDLSKRLHTWDEDMCRNSPHMFDLVITLGGDGTVLYASWLFQKIVPPVLSFALGSLGFLTKFDFADYQQSLTQAFNGGVTISLRLRFEATVMRSWSRARIQAAAGIDKVQPHLDLVEELLGEENANEPTHQPDGTYEILNEVVVDRGPNSTMSCIEIFGDDEHFTTVLADGVCVSTPTGSTAYNLAAGGSLCHPENPVLLVTSICAHTLSFRPLVLPDTIVLRVGMPYDARTNSWASFDSRKRVELRAGDYVTVSASRFPFAMVQGQGGRGHDWINSISGKLGWNTRHKQKAYHG